MFVSRAAVLSGDRQCGQTVLIEIDEPYEVDKAVIPAVLEIVLHDIIDRASEHESDKPNIVLLSVDRAPREFGGLVRRCCIPPSNVIDGFSEWYSLQRTGDLKSKTTELKRRSVQIGMHHPSSREEGSLAGEVIGTLEASVHRKSKHKIIVIDSLTSIFRLSPGIRSFLDLRDALFEAARNCGSDCRMTLLSTIRRGGRDDGFVGSLRRVVDTFVLLNQGERVRGENKRFGANVPENSREVVTLRICKRKMSGRVQLEEMICRMKWDTQTLSQVEVMGMGDSDLASLSNKEEEERRQEEALAKLGLSFRVSLSTKEKEVRAAAGLPYLHRDEDLADSALQLHPQALQIRHVSKGGPKDGDDTGNDSNSEEGLFSEDV